MNARIACQAVLAATTAGAGGGTDADVHKAVSAARLALEMAGLSQPSHGSLIAALERLQATYRYYLKVHDPMWSPVFAHARGELSFQPVTSEIVTKDAALLEISITLADGRREIIQTTDEHPFWVECATDGRSASWQRAAVLQPGDQLRTLTGVAFVESLQFLRAREQVYNLSISNVHTYHVGPDGVLVHNCGEMNAAERLAGERLTQMGRTWSRVPTDPAKKTADFIIDGVETEFKTVNAWGNTTLKNALEDATEQTTKRILVNITNGAAKADEVMTQILRAEGNLVSRGKAALTGRLEIWLPDGSSVF